MFLLGHMCWGFIIGTASRKAIVRARPLPSINPHLLLLLSVLPDSDFLLGFLGITHRTWAHSIFVWAIVFAPFFYKYRLQSIPYFSALVQHMLFGDAIVGLNTPFWPVSTTSFGFGFDSLSIQNVSVEELGLSMLVAWTILDRNIRNEFLSMSRGIRIIVPILNLIALVGFSLSTFFSQTAINTLSNADLVLNPGSLEKAASLMVSASLFPAELAMHWTLIAFICAMLAIGFILHRQKPKLRA
jgi:membrane-bound metal-dependent hydrolase YbcI (DUF457 family)